MEALLLFAGALLGMGVGIAGTLAFLADEKPDRFGRVVVTTTYAGGDTERLAEGIRRQFRRAGQVEPNKAVYPHSQPGPTPDDYPMPDPHIRKATTP